MSKLTIAQHDELQSAVAERYRRDGYEVTIEPGSAAIPFDLGGYAPDLMARKANVTLIIEIRTQVEKTSFDRLRTIVAEVRQHEGWRFVLVTGQDVMPADVPGENQDNFSWSDISHRIEDSDRLSDVGQKEAAYLVLWITFERMMRFQARRVGLPVDRLAPSILIRQLYSQGELSMSQFDIALDCQVVRNQTVHGFPSADLVWSVTRLGTLVREVQEQWSAPVAGT